MTVRCATPNDLEAIAAINRLSFSGNKPAGVAERWVRCNFARFPQYHYFIAEEGGATTGFIGWEIKNGFHRAVPVVELDQLGVHPDFQRRGIGTALVKETFEMMKVWFRSERKDAHILRVIVWTRKKDSFAARLYGTLASQGFAGEVNRFSAIEDGPDSVLLRGEYEL